jgi:hypothetical protein
MKVRRHVPRKPLVPYQLSMENLITVVTRFQLPAGVTTDQIRAAFDETAPGFRNVPGLVRKQFLCSKDCRTAGGVYLWNDEHAACAFMNERVPPMIRDKFHVDPWAVRVHETVTLYPGTPRTPNARIVRTSTKPK